MKAAVYCGTRNLYEKMPTAAKSLLYNSDVDKVYFLIEDDEFPEALPCQIETINVSGQKFFYHGGPNWSSPWTWMVLMRAALHRVFPDLDRILSLDVDTIVDKDISEMWSWPLDKYWLAGADEYKKTKSEGIFYINCGVMMQNLKKLREDGKGDQIIQKLNTFHYEYNEQDCINRYCQGGILEIPSDYNASYYTMPTKNPKIVHFASVRNYIEHPLYIKYRDMPWR